MTDQTINNCYIAIDPSWEHRALWQSPIGNQLNFTYVDFEGGIDEAAQANYADTDITGRAEPFKAFLGNASKEVSLSISFMAQSSDVQREVVDPGRFLDALKYGLFDPGTELTTEAPPCILKIGTLFTGRVVLTNGDPKWQGPIDIETLLPHRCDFDATFSVVRTFQADLSYRFDGVWT
jgi:hypothetical protein